MADQKYSHFYGHDDEYDPYAETKVPTGILKPVNASGHDQDPLSPHFDLRFEVPVVPNRRDSQDPTMTTNPYEEMQTAYPPPPSPTPPFSLRSALEDIARRRAQANIQPRQLGVSWNNLTVEGLGEASGWQPTIGDTFNPVEWVRGFQEGRRKGKDVGIRKILDSFEGVVKPGEMLCASIFLRSIPR